MNINGETHELQKRRSGRGMTIVFFLISGIIAATWASRIPELQAKLRLNNAEWGTVLFASPVGLVCGLLVASWLTSHFGAKKIMLASSFLACILLIFAGYSNERIQLMIVLFFMGFSRTILNISANTLSLTVQKMYTKPIISTFHGLWSLACFIAASIGSLMIMLNIIPGHHFLGMAMLCILSSLFYFKSQHGGKLNGTEKKPFFVRPDSYLFLLGCIAFCGMICENAIFDWSVNYFETTVLARKGLVTTGYQCFIISMTLGRLFGDRMVGRYGPVKMLFINGALIAFGFVLAAAFPAFLPAAIGFIIIGLGDSLVVPIVYSLTSRSKSTPPAYALSAVTLVGYSGFLTGPLLIGFLSTWIGMQWTFAIIGLFGAGIIILARQVRKRDELIMDV
jgi:fucose permease